MVWLTGKKQRRLSLSLAVFFVQIFVIFLYNIHLVRGGTYTSSAHGNSTTGVNRQAVTITPYPDASPYAVGHCGHCHEQHASIEGVEPPPTGDTQNPYALFKENYGIDKNRLCYACHETFTLGGQPLGYGRYGVYQGSSKYDVSIHNTDTAAMRWPDGSRPGPNYLDGGNCNNCHNPHGYNDGSLIPSMIFKREEGLCNACHDGSPETKNVAADVAKFYSHKVSSYSGVHNPATEYANENTTKHVECVDCHNPHTVGATTHTAGTNTIATTSPLYRALGSTPNYGATNWTAPSSYTVQTATKEYEICFKCHSSANSNYATWGGAGAAAWNDVGLEFNPNNQSYHPVVSALPVADPGANGSSRLSANRLFNGWTPGQTMYCSDCHESDSSVAGPHGSATKWMLAGTNKAWPYITNELNGSSSTTKTDFRHLNNINTNYNNANNDGLFCLNCHPMCNDAGGPANMTESGVENVNNAHGKHAFRGLSSRNCACVDCHIRVPHGGKVSRLQAGQIGVMPNRYAPNGAGSKISGGTWTMLKFIKRSSATSYNDSDCYGSGDTAWDNCDKHNSPNSGEYW